MEAITQAPARARVLRAFQSRDFRRLWTGQAISLLGDSAFLIALGWRTFTLTGSARSLGFVLTLQGVGLLTTLLVGGALADRYDRRTLMLVSDAARFAIIAALATVDATGHLSIGLLAGIAFAEGLATGFFTPALGGLFAFVLMFQWAPIQVLTPKLVREHFHLGVRAYGLVFSMLGAGMIVGATAFGQLNPRRRRGLASYLIWMVNSFFVIVFSLSPWYSLAVVASFFRGICIGFGVAVWETMLMELVPQHMLSRVVSLDWFGALRLTPFRLLAAGAVSGLAGPGTIIALGACISLLLVAAGLSSKQIREID